MPERARYTLLVPRSRYSQVIDRLLEFEGVVRACLSARPARRGMVRITADARRPTRESLANLAMEIRGVVPYVESMMISIGTQHSSARGWIRFDVPRDRDFRMDFDRARNSWVTLGSDLERRARDEFVQWLRQQHAILRGSEEFRTEFEQAPPEIAGTIILDLVSRILSVARSGN